MVTTPLPPRPTHLMPPCLHRPLKTPNQLSPLVLFKALSQMVSDLSNTPSKIPCGPTTSLLISVRPTGLTGAVVYLLSPALVAFVLGSTVHALALMNLPTPTLTGYGCKTTTSSALLF